MIPSRDNDDQKRLQTDWLRAFKHLTEKPDFSRRTFAELQTTLLCTVFRGKTHQWIKYFDKCQKNPTLKEYLGFFLI